MRLFIGIILNSKNIIGNYTNLFNNLTKFIDGKWVEPHNLHITLNFIGELSDELVPKLIMEIQPHLQDYTDKVEIKGLTGFPNIWNPKQIVCKIINESNKLNELNKEFIEILNKNQINVDNQRYLPHMTLVRIKRLSPGYDAAIKPYLNYSIAEIESFKVDLIKSELTRSGPIYSKL
jgi:2'-5' RNA ligase